MTGQLPAARPGPRVKRKPTMFESLKLGRPFGINLYLHGTFWLLPAFVLLSGVMTYGLDTALLDVGALLAIFGCVALHELGHALAARGYGIGTRDITLYPIGGVARLERMPERPWQEIAVALAGPAVNVVIAAGLLVPLMMLDGVRALPRGRLSSRPARCSGTWCCRRTSMLVLFNMLPAFPMDGGRVLRAVLAIGSRPGCGPPRMAATVGAGVRRRCSSARSGSDWPSGSPMLMILAFFLFAARAGRAGRRPARGGGAAVPRPVRDDVPTVNVFGLPVARPVNEPTGRPADGWEYDTRRRVWVEWRDGYPVRVARPEE